MLSLVLNKKVNPQILYLDGRTNNPGIFYSWWDKSLPTKQTFEKWLIDKEYLNSPLQFKAPKTISTEL